MRRACVAMLLVAPLVACGGATSPAALLLTIAPNPVRTLPVSGPCPPETTCTSFPSAASWTLTLRTATSGRLEAADLAVFRTGTLIASRHYGADDFIRDAGTDRVRAGGSLVLSQGLQYPVPMVVTERAASILEVTIRFTPDTGTPIVQSVTAAVP